MTWETAIEFLSTTVVLGNSLLAYAWFLLTLFGLIILFQVIQSVILKRLERLVQRSHTDLDDVVVRVVKTIKPPFYLFLALYWSLRSLSIIPFLQRIINVFLIVWVIVQAVVALQVAIDAVFQRRIKSERHKGHQSVLEVMRGVVRFVLWTVGLLFVLSNLGININSLIAGLGIGGIAVALAAQNILSDLFNSLVIYFDQPFEVGDFIVIGEDKGTVQRIGVKSTRVKSLSGEEIIIPNRDIAAARIKNFKRLHERRISFRVGVEASASPERLREVPALIEGVIKDIPHVRFGRAHLHELTEHNMYFEVIYHVLDHDYSVYMNVHQRILLGLVSAFGNEKISTTPTT